MFICFPMTKRTRTVFRTAPNLGKSDTPLPRVSTEDSRRVSDVRRDATQSLYVDGPGECDIVERGKAVVDPVRVACRYLSKGSLARRQVVFV